MASLRTKPWCLFLPLAHRRHSSPRSFWRDWHQVRIQVPAEHPAATPEPWCLREVRHVPDLPPTAPLLHHQLLPARVLEMWMDGSRKPGQDWKRNPHRQQGGQATAVWTQGRVWQGWPQHGGALWGTHRQALQTLSQGFATELCSHTRDRLNANIRTCNQFSHMQDFWDGNL